MSTPVFRPTFSYETSLSNSEFIVKAESLIEANPQLLEGQVARDHALFSFVEPQRHFWSPWLHLELRQTDGERKIYGRFSPHPSVWTAFMFSYLATAVIAFFAMIFGWAQQIAGEYPWAFWLLPVCGAGAILLWFIARTGQRLAHEQMSELRELVSRWDSSPATKF